MPIPAPITPQIAIASSTDGKAKNTSTTRMIAMLTTRPLIPAIRPSVPPISVAASTGVMPQISDNRPP